MKKKLEIKTIKLKSERYAESLPYGLLNFTHCEFNSGGIVLTSDKNFEHLKKAVVFIPYGIVEFISLLK